MEREKPFRFTPLQLRIATADFSNQLGAGGFGTVYRGLLADGVPVAVKVLRGSSDERIAEQFMAEVSTIGRTHHPNLVRLYGFCYEDGLRALVYEYMPMGLAGRAPVRREERRGRGRRLGEAPRDSGGDGEGHRVPARGVQAEDHTLRHQAGERAARRGALPEGGGLRAGEADGQGQEPRDDERRAGMWMPFPVTHKCDVYSFGMLLFVVVGRRRNHVAESQEWLPMWVWKRFERGEVGGAMAACGVEEEERERAARVAAVALLCVQYRPELRPGMGEVVKMLEGGAEIPRPSNPFQYLMGGSHHGQAQESDWTGAGTLSTSGF